MQMSPVLDVFLGLVLLYLLLSMLCMAVNEMISSVLGMRSSTLAAGLTRLLDDPNVKAAFYDQGTTQGVMNAGGDRHPSYMPGTMFARTLLDVVANGANDGPSVIATLNSLPPSNIRDILLALSNQADTDLTRMRQAIADWFDHSMQWVSTLYKRRIQIISLLVAAGMAGAINADTFVIARTLWSDTALRSEITALAPTLAGTDQASTNGPAASIAAIDKDLRPFPLGWDRETFPPRSDLSAYIHFLLIKLAGLILTIIALSLGAPFWFDILTKIVDIRGGANKAAAAPAKN